VVATDGRLSGLVAPVLDGDSADLLLVAARDGDELGLFEVAADAEGLRRRHTPAMDPTTRLGGVSLEHTPAKRIGGDLTDAFTRLRAVGAAAVAAMQVGVAQRGLDMTVAYAKERRQFGRPIGSFQALKHRMADMLVLVETARSAAMDAAFAVADDDPALVRRTSVAKAWCSEALTAVAAETVQLHGGIAITWEHDAHLVLKRAHALNHLFGAPHHHRRAVMSS
jgi:alkylation response protein AidB-like acyl-CoA dehydrogenase